MANVTPATALPLIASDCGDGSWIVIEDVETEGEDAYWTPNEATLAEIVASANPAEAAVRICGASEHRGEWSA